MLRTSISTIFILIWYFSNSQIINPAWQFVGPKSTNTPNVPPSHIDYNPFLTGRIDDIAVNPSDPSHVIVSGFFAGIWESNDYISGSNPSATWHLLQYFDNQLPLGMGDNEVRAVAFRNATELYAISASAVYKYDYNGIPNPIWTKLMQLQLPPSNVVANEIVFMPNNPDRVFVCTTAGLVESIDGGQTWVQSPAITGEIFIIVFIEKSVPGTYYFFISGQTPTGNVLLMISDDDGVTFNDIQPYTNWYNSINSYSGICLGDQTAANGNRDLYITTAANPNLNWSQAHRDLHKLTININTGSIININQFNNATMPQFPGDVPARMIIGYQRINNVNLILTGGARLYSFNESTNISNQVSGIHDDFHAIYIGNSGQRDPTFPGQSDPTRFLNRHPTQAFLLS